AWSVSPSAGTEAAAETKKSDKPAAKPEIGAANYPFGPYGWSALPQAGAWLITNATVWTNEKEGILQNADVLMRAGKIVQVGKGIKAPDATVIDGTGKHVTAGIIDEHSHIAASRVINEGSQVSSAEVRIGDIINSEDINIYRQLSGGVTTAQILHGSANPIGGQSAIIKLRWGYTPEKMLFEGAPGFIKFALGENVKQSGWTGSDRYPQTRMGVEEVFDDYFTRAREYGALKASGKPYRKDLDLETVGRFCKASASSPAIRIARARSTC
ncbi:MAG TPA: amidohydrolase, partial [Saprospiraceae bacterium]|nr:amidohydrolase [Saprospiraceae bacterium]